jgi:hypothetical protein
VVNGDTLLVDMARDIGNQRFVLNGVVPHHCNDALPRGLPVILWREITRRPGYAAGARWFHAAA